MSEVCVEGLGHVFLSLFCPVKWSRLATLGKPRLLRGENLQDAYEHERKMTFSELFFDLIFVTGVRRLGDMLRESLLKETSDHAEAEGLSVPQYIAFFSLLWTLCAGA